MSEEYPEEPPPWFRELPYALQLLIIECNPDIPESWLSQPSRGIPAEWLEWQRVREWGFLAPAGLAPAYALGMVERAYRAGQIPAFWGGEAWTYQGRESYYRGYLGQLIGYKMGQWETPEWLPGAIQGAKVSEAYWRFQERFTPISEAWSAARIGLYMAPALGHPEWGLARALGFPFYEAAQKLLAAQAVAPYTEGLTFENFLKTSAGWIAQRPTWEEFTIGGLTQWTVAQNIGWAARAGVESWLGGRGFLVGAKESLLQTVGINLMQPGVELVIGTLGHWAVLSRLGYTEQAQAYWQSVEAQQRMIVGVALTAGGAALQWGIIPYLTRPGEIFAPTAGWMMPPAYGAFRGPAAGVGAPSDLGWQWGLELGGGIRGPAIQPTGFDPRGWGGGRWRDPTTGRWVSEPAALDVDIEATIVGGARLQPTFARGVAGLAGGIVGGIVGAWGVQQLAKLPIYNEETGEVTQVRLSDLQRSLLNLAGFYGGALGGQILATRLFERLAPKAAWAIGGRGAELAPGLQVALWGVSSAYDIYMKAIGPQGGISIADIPTAFYTGSPFGRIGQLAFSLLPDQGEWPVSLWRDVAKRGGAIGAVGGFMEWALTNIFGAGAGEYPSLTTGEIDLISQELKFLDMERKILSSPDALQENNRRAREIVGKLAASLAGPGGGISYRAGFTEEIVWGYWRRELRPSLEQFRLGVREVTNLGYGTLGIWGGADIFKALDPLWTEYSWLSNLAWEKMEIYAKEFGVYVGPRGALPDVGWESLGLTRQTGYIPEERPPTLGMVPRIDLGYADWESMGAIAQEERRRQAWARKIEAAAGPIWERYWEIFGGSPFLQGTLYGSVMAQITQGLT